MQGKSFRNILINHASTIRDMVFTSVANSSFMTFDGRWKFILHRRSDTDELYNLADDPGEMKNLADDSKYSAIVVNKRQEIFRWLDETGHPHLSYFREKSQ